MVARKRTEDVRVHRDVAQLLGEKPVQQRREWVVDRVGWIVMALVLTAALAGLWGSGPLSNAEATSADGRLSISYDRFVRNHGSTVIEVRVGPDVAVDRVVGVGIDSDYLLQNQVRAITPNPSSVTALGGYDVYAFDVGPGAPLTVRFDLRPDPGAWAAAHTAQFRIAGSPTMRIRQYVYP